MSTDDLLLLDDSPDATVEMGRCWNVVVIDDDDEVHQATTITLRNAVLQGRPLQLVHFHSAEEARRRLPELRDVAVILLDVVMETPDAGLALISFIRKECGLDQTRIILRTGQPGYAPELEVLEAHDINDYRTKSELTRTRLLSAMSTAIRGYQQINALAESRRGLEIIVRAAPHLLSAQAVGEFAEGVLTQMAALLKVPVDGIVCAQRGSPVDANDHRWFVVGAAGALAPLMLRPLEELPDSRVVAAIKDALVQKRNCFLNDASVLYLTTGRREAAIFVEAHRRLDALDLELLELFAVNIASCFSAVQCNEAMSTRNALPC